MTCLISEIQSILEQNINRFCYRRMRLVLLTLLVAGLVMDLTIAAPKLYLVHIRKGKKNSFKSAYFSLALFMN